MKKLLSFLFVGVVLVAFTGVSYGAIGWAGNIWPVHEATVADNNNVGVYLQIWKGGVTDAAGQGAGIGATLFYGPNGGPYTSVAMTYNTDVGNNDEYTASIPAAALTGQSEIWFYCEGYDSSDASTYTGAQDQNNNAPPFKLNITQVLDQDVTVVFSLCLPPEGNPDYDPTPGNVCLIGDHPEIGNWSAGVVMNQPCAVSSPQRYEVSILFPAGSNPYVEYKHQKNDCSNWEPGGNHSVFIDDSAPVYVIPWTDHWGYFEGDDCTPCGVPVEDTSWGMIKTIYK
jgi:hypothetical protein